VPTYYNPAAIGQTDMIKIRGGARLQWVGIDNAPQTFIVTGDMPLKLFNKRFGVGLVLDQESIGLYKTLNLDAQLGYKFKKWGGEFTAAVNVGMYDESFKGSEVVIPDDDDYHQSTDDAIPTTDIHGTTIDLGVGIWYKHPKFWAGLSMTHVNSPTVTMNSDSGSSESTERTFEFQAGRTLYFMGGCNIQIKNTLFEMIPSVLVKSDFTFTTGELTARARYNKFLSFGVGYRWDDAVVVTLGAEIKNFYIGYSYDYATSAISKASSGSHEVFVGYSLKLDLGDKNRNRHKSIRLM
jgi:type IX secretion system PorP/SprF family membrane protein